MECAESCLTLHASGAPLRVGNTVMQISPNFPYNLGGKFRDKMHETW